MRIVCYPVLFLVLLLCACGSKEKHDVNSPEGFNQVLAKNPADTAALYSRARYYIKAGVMDSALLDMKSLVKLDSSRAAYFITLGDIYLFTNRTRFTRQAYEKAIRLDPSNEEAHMKLAELYLYVEMRQESLNELNEVLKLNKHNPKAYYMKGMVYKEGGETAMALSSFLTATEQDPEYALAYEQLGLIYAANQDKRSIDFFKNAIRINPKNPLVYYNMGLFYQDNGEPEKAIETYRELLAIEPGYANAAYNIGYIKYGVEKNNTDAFVWFEKAANLNKAYAEAYYMMGLCKEEMGQKAEAIKHYQMSLRANPRFGLALQALSRLGVNQNS